MTKSLPVQGCDVPMATALMQTMKLYKGAFYMIGLPTR